ncbi:hypothetical protein NZ47_10510 [Anaerovibrio lipolyticus]|uniref:Flagellin N-methylase n=1 Tax=Anaerovibrio lipolyticus TaxID=82374 RepID=A0A0B2JSY2_9FIRM|nr:YkgJ family cysteine cluster protein [Anaerovibrio lipolyticus]KHM51450.1 hypothetical protein NZ47_10510 [Anaerovibrio lipolyticus]
MFPCSRCGNCCKSIGKTIWGKAMALEDGSCKWLNTETNLCTIYNNRPTMCNVDECYEKFYITEMSRDDFYQLNKQVCHMLQK